MTKIEIWKETDNGKLRVSQMQWWNSQSWHPHSGTTVLPCVVIKRPSSSMNLHVWGFPCLLCSDRWSRALIGSRWRAISQVAPWKNIPAHKSNYKRAGFLTLVRVCDWPQIASVQLSLSPDNNVMDGNKGKWTDHTFVTWRQWGHKWTNFNEAKINY